MRVVVVVVVSVLATAPSAFSATSSRPLPALAAVRHDLGVLAGETRSPAAKRALVTAEGAVGRATAPTLWLDPGHLVAPSYGLSAFTDSRAALVALERISGAALPSGALAGVEARILAADRDLAEGSILQARGGSGGLLARAAGMVLSGDRWAGTSRVDLAAEQYGAGWNDAFQALTGLVLGRATSVPMATLGAAARNALRTPAIVPMGAHRVSRRPELEASGKPEVLFVGMESCVFCAVERWGLVIALSRFGTFTNLQLGESQTTAVPVVQSFTFARARYESPYVSLVAVELSGDASRSKLTAAQSSLFRALDPKRIAPLVDVANRMRDVGATEQAGLIGGASWLRLAGSLRNARSAAGQAIAATAEVLTAEICRATGGAPASVCGGVVVQEYSSRLARFGGRGPGCVVGRGAARRRLAASWSFRSTPLGRRRVT